jgi:hypothetical protein
MRLIIEPLVRGNYTSPPSHHAATIVAVCTVGIPGTPGHRHPVEMGRLSEQYRGGCNLM